MCESAKVSGMVTSHAMGFPIDHGSRVTLSGLLLSLVVRPRGSFVEGT